MPMYWFPLFLAMLILGTSNFVMIANTNGDMTEKLINADNFLIQFYNFHEQPGMTTVNFGLDGFTQAYVAYNQKCGK
jgi:hypothetical protein